MSPVMHRLWNLNVMRVLAKRDKDPFLKDILESKVNNLMKRLRESDDESLMALVVHLRKELDADTVARLEANAAREARASTKSADRPVKKRRVADALAIAAPSSFVASAGKAPVLSVVGGKASASEALAKTEQEKKRKRKGCQETGQGGPEGC